MITSWRAMVGTTIVLLAAVGGASGIEASAEGMAGPTAASEPRDLRAAAHFTFELADQASELGEWTDAVGYREASAWATYSVTASDPRIAGTLTMAANIRAFDPGQGPDQITDPIYVMVGNVQIATEAGAWVGTSEGPDDGGLVRLEGTGGYAGLRAVMAMGWSGGHGIILSADELPTPDPPARPDAVSELTSPGDPSPWDAGRVSMGLSGVQEGEELWTQADGAQWFSRPSVVGRIEVDDPRMSGTLSWTIEGRYFESDEGDFWIATSAMRIDDEAGAWVGTGEHLWVNRRTDHWVSGQAVLTGEGAYDGLTAILGGRFFGDERWPGFDTEGVIVPGGLPPVPEPVEAIPTGTEGGT